MVLKYKIRTKHNLTKQFLKELNIKITRKSLRDYMRLIWHDPREQGLNHLKLTPEGLEFLQNKLQLKSYQIDFHDQIKFTNNLILWLEKYMDTPYFISKTGITVFKEKTAVELLMLDGNIYRFGEIKNINNNESLETPSLDNFTTP